MMKTTDLDCWYQIHNKIIQQ